MTNKVNDFFYILKYLEGKQLFIFGAGIDGENLSQFLSLISKDRIRFIDNDESKWGSNKNGIEILSPNHLLEYSRDSIFIFVAGHYKREMGAQLKEMGFVDGKDFILIPKRLKPYTETNENSEMDLAVILNEDIQPDNKANDPKKQILADLYKNASEPSELYVPFEQFPIELQHHDPKIITFYLPQFHPINENDLWWGKGFTEWTNVTKAVPQYAGHYQPHLPGEFGFYDLRIQSIQERQVELAKNYGVYGFCFHYYWFNGGKRLLEAPLNQFVENKNIDFPFCVCWANENWTRRWDGAENLILMQQDHSPENDAQCMKDLIQLFKHKNYIKIGNRPLLIVYRPEILNDVEHTIQIWNELLKQEGFDGVYLVGAQTFGFMDPTEIGFDAAVEFPPHNMKRLTEISDDLVITNPDFTGFVNDYESFVKRKNYMDRESYKVFKTAFPGWDNTARKPNNSIVFHGTTPSLYQEWLENIIHHSKSSESNLDECIVFVNAWNEWAEGAHLEPDRKYGYAYLQATANAIKASRSRNSD